MNASLDHYWLFLPHSVPFFWRSGKHVLSLPVLTGTSASMSGRARTNNAALAGGLIALVAAGALFPLFFSQQGPKVRCARSLLPAGLQLCVDDNVATVNRRCKVSANTSTIPGDFPCRQLDSGRRCRLTPASLCLAKRAYGDRTQTQARVTPGLTPTSSLWVGNTARFAPVILRQCRWSHIILGLPSSPLQTAVWQCCPLTSTLPRSLVWLQRPKQGSQSNEQACLVQGAPHDFAGCVCRWRAAIAAPGAPSGSGLWRAAPLLAFRAQQAGSRGSRCCQG